MDRLLPTCWQIVPDFSIRILTESSPQTGERGTNFVQGGQDPEQFKTFSQGHRKRWNWATGFMGSHKTRATGGETFFLHSKEKIDFSTIPKGSGPESTSNSGTAIALSPTGVSLSKGNCFLPMNTNLQILIEGAVEKTILFLLMNTEKSI